jgi:hypothetical protein
MNKGVLLVVTVAASGMTLCCAAEEAPCRKQPLLGVVRQDTVFVCYAHANGSAAWVQYARLPKAERVDTQVAGAAGYYYPPRWRVGHGQILITEDMALGAAGKDRSPPVHELQSYSLPDVLDGHTRVGHAKVDFDREKESSAPYYMVGGPVGRLRSAGHFVQFEDPISYLDYLPVAEHEVELFVLTNIGPRRKQEGDSHEWDERIVDLNGPARVIPSWWFGQYRYRGNWLEKDQAWDEKGKWLVGDSLEVAFKEPFQVFPKGGAYFFVTESGKVYHSPKPDKPGDRKVTAVWDDPKQPVSVILTQEETGKTFVFGTAEAAGLKERRGFYFELDAKPDPVEVEAKALPGVDKAEPLKTAVEYTRFLLDQKKITLNPPK